MCESVIDFFIHSWKIIKSIPPNYLSFFAALASAITAILTYLSNKKKDINFLVPRLFLHKFNKNYLYNVTPDEHVRFSSEEYLSDKYHLTFTNISNSKLYDLNVNIQIEEDSNVNKFINYIDNNESYYFFLEKDENGEESYSFEKVLGVEYETDFHKNILSSEGEINITLPSFIWMIIDGYNIYMKNFIDRLNPSLSTEEKANKVKNESSIKLNLKLNISYTHSLTKKNVIIDQNFPIYLELSYPWVNTQVSWNALQLPQK